MDWILILPLLLVLPLLGALLALALRRVLPKRGSLLIAALSLFLASAAILVLVPRVTPSQDLAQVISPPSPGVGLQVAPTSEWVQPPRTLLVPTAVPTVATVTPTLDLARVTLTPTPHPFSLATIVVRNGTGETGLATRTSSLLAEQGFRVLPPEDDPEQGSRPHTLILDRGDHLAVRQALAEFLHVAPEYIQVDAEMPTTEADIVLILGDDVGLLASATAVPTPLLVGEPTATPNPYAGATIVVRNGTVGRPGLATRVADGLKAQGFLVLGVEDDDNAGLRPNTLLLDRGDHTGVREALVSLLKIDPAYVQVNSGASAEADIILILGDDFEE